MDLRSVRSFATELIKLAMEDDTFPDQRNDILDADIRALHAERAGKRILPAGRLNTNSESETGFKPKIAAGFGTVYNLKAKTKKPGKYQETRDYALAGAKGGMLAAGMGELGSRILRDPNKRLSQRGYRIAVPIGAAAAIADRYYRRKEEKKPEQMVISKAKLAGFRTPGMELARTGRVARDVNKVHAGVPAKAAAGTMGKDFRLPGY